MGCLKKGGMLKQLMGRGKKDEICFWLVDGRILM